MMSLQSDSLLERLHLKKQLKKWQALAVIGFVGMVVVAVSLFSNRGFERSYIAQVAIRDVIYNDSYRIKVLKGLVDNEAVKAVVLRINSPGGTIVGLSLIHI